ncbi:MAG: hypothetical protein Q9170_008288 [Blastenia crenularia]
MPIVQVAINENRQLQNIANILASAKKIVMITGAGISTNCGIPDFRSEDGLYALIQSQYEKASPNGNQESERSKSPRIQDRDSITKQCQTANLATSIKGKDLFDSRIWKDTKSTSVFYSFVASLRRQIRDEVKQITPTHRFIRTIRDSRKLVRCYTQNIDGLESRLGLCMDLDRGRGNRSRFAAKSKKTPFARTNEAPGGDMDGGCEVVPLHGDLTVLRCTLCRETCAWEDRNREAAFLKGKAPECLSCALSDQQRRDRGKRGTKIGSLRPNIVLYGEEHPTADTLGSITTHDLSLAPDVLLILGTSLHVQGVKTLVKEFAKCVHARPKAKGKVIFVNLSKPSESIWKESIDYWVSMDCDAWIGTLRRHRPDIWHVQTELKSRVIKKDVPRCKEVSMSIKSTTANAEEKENEVFTSRKLSSPHRRSPGRPRTRPLGQIDNNEVSRIQSEKRKRVCCADSEASETDEITCYLPTPPPSKHKNSAREQERKRQRDQEDSELLKTPSKKTRLSVQSKQSEIPCSLEIKKNQYTPSKRRKRTVEIWED